MLPPAKISGTTLEKTVIAEGCIINASRIETSVVGIRTRIGNGTTIAHSYIMGSDYYETLEEIDSTSGRGLPHLYHAPSIAPLNFSCLPTSLLGNIYILSFEKST